MVGLPKPEDFSYSWKIKFLLLDVHVEPKAHSAWRPNPFLKIWNHWPMQTVQKIPIKMLFRFYRFYPFQQKLFRKVIIYVICKALRNCHSIPLEIIDRSNNLGTIGCWAFILVLRCGSLQHDLVVFSRNHKSRSTATNSLPNYFILSHSERLCFFLK